MKVAVLGGVGRMGKGIVRDLVSKESKDIEKVVIADVSVKRAKGIVEELGDRRLEAVRLDISYSETAENRLCIGLSQSLALLAPGKWY